VTILNTKTAADADQSDAVNAVVACFGPTDVVATFEHSQTVPGSDVLQYSLFGTDRTKWDQLKREMSPFTKSRRENPTHRFYSYTGMPIKSCLPTNGANV
jgi:hypothetical protein